PEAHARYYKGRAASIRRSREWRPAIERSNDFGAFMRLEAQALQSRHGISPVHTPEEIHLLGERFPDNIKLFCVRRAGRMVAGTIIYETPMVAHAQYIGATDEGREAHAVDALLHELIVRVYARKRWFDFGISTTEGGRVLNEGLCRNKESFGARAVVY